MAIGKRIKDFVRNGIRSRHIPKAAVLIMAGTLMSATAALHIPGEAGSTPVQAAMLRTTSPASQLLADQSSLFQLIKFEADQAGTIQYRDYEGKPATYSVPNLERAIINHLAMVQERRDPASDRSTDALYGIDDGMWAWMMRRHSSAAGLSAYMDGIVVNDDGSIDAPSAAKLEAMLQLKNNPVAATRMFAVWLASEIMEFDGSVGRRPTAGEIAVIGMTDASGGLDAASLAKDFPDTKLGPTIQIEHSSFKRAFFIDRNGWMSAKDTIASFESRAKKSMDRDGPIPVRTDRGPLLDEDLTAAELRKDPERFARIVMDATKSMSESSRALLSRIAEDSGLDSQEMDVRIANALVAMTVTIDELRGRDVSGGIYAQGAGQWLQAAKLYGDPAFVGSFAEGIEQKLDGRVHAKSAEQFGTFLRLRDNGPIATQIVLDKLIAQTSTLRRDLGRLPSTDELVVSHLFGIAAGEQFAQAATSGQSITLGFSPGDPRNIWGAAFNQIGGDASTLKKALESVRHDRGHAISEHLERYADATPAMRP